MDFTSFSNPGFSIGNFEERAQGAMLMAKGHTKNKSKRTKDKHEAGDARRKRDQERSNKKKKENE